MKKIFTIISFVGVAFFFISTLNAQDSTIEKSNPCIACEQLMGLRLPDVTIEFAEKIADSNPYCRLRGIIGREIKFELLLPDQWNGRYILGGGGGFVGQIWNAAESSVNDGYATSGTDTGHEDKWFLGEWALNDMEKQLNFGHLAIHRTAEVSKAIIAEYYGNYPQYSYMVGCSRGGSQAMMEAQRYPDDFDGLVAGAPSYDWTGFAAEFIQNEQAVYPSKHTEPIITPDHIRILYNAILEQCDLIDGVRDSIINNPTKCKFDFDLLPKCPDEVTGKDCFTSYQINAIKTIYDGIETGNGISYPGFPFGGENEPSGWLEWIIGPVDWLHEYGYPTYQAAIASEVVKYFVLNDPDWNYLSDNFTEYEKEITYANAYLSSTATDYIEFKNHNGKIIFWHGWNDPALSAYSTIDHYNAVKANDPDIESYMRLFLLPGVLHCGGGKGPDYVDWIAIIRNWVENNIPPDKIIAKKFINGKELMSRPIFPYPGNAVYDGSGDPNIESSWIEKK